MIIKNVLIMSKYKLPHALKVCEKIIDLFNGKVKIYLDPDTARLLGEKYSPFPENFKDLKNPIAISIGGDGTFLRLAHMILPYNIPILGIRPGKTSLCYLCDYEDKSIDKLVNELLNNSFTIIEKSVGQLEFKGLIDYFINEIVIKNPKHEKMIRFKLKVNEEILFYARADGLIISTSIGSTGYALSSGGPIIDPSLDVIEISAISPFSAINKPIILSSKRKIDITVLDDAIIILDGKTSYSIRKKSNIRISTSTNIRLRLITTKYVRSLPEKLFDRLVDRPFIFVQGIS